MTNQEFLEAMEVLAASIPRFAPPNIQATAAVWYDHFRDVSPRDFMEIIKAASLRFKEFPSLADLKILLFGDPMAEADALPDIIWSCICDYGQQAAKIPRIKERLGPLGWAFVESVGGWSAICNQATHNDQAPTLKAQWRNGIKSVANGPGLVPRSHGALGSSQVSDAIALLADRFSLDQPRPSR